VTRLFLLAAACPDCPTTREARSLLLAEDLWTNTWFAVLPFAIAGLAVRVFVRHLDRGAHDEGSDEP
jgi:hypothetical protein